MAKQRKGNILPWLAVMTWMGFIFILSHQPVDESSALSTSLTDKIRSVIKSVFPSITLNMETLHKLIQMGLYLFAFLILLFIVAHVFRSPKRKGLIISLLPWLAIIGWIAIFFTLSQHSGHQFSEISATMTNAFHRVMEIFFPSLTHDDRTFYLLIRKSAHFFEYMLLGALILHALRHRLFSGAIIAVFISAIYAMTDEFHQLFVPGRGAEIRDVMIDSLGAMTGVAIYFVLYICFKSLFGRKK
ncbi:MAG TPA: VanZ family protein [Virgibacillus sp.]|nr:VanZ family protein [Virgibacillus sp.]